MRRLLARPAAVTTGARDTASKAAGSLERAVGAVIASGPCADRLQPVEIAERRCSGRSDAFQEPRHPGDTDARAEAIELRFRRQPEGEGYRTAEAAGAPETGGKEDSVERERLFHRGAVHPGAGAKPGLN